MEVAQPINQTHVVTIPTKQDVSAPGVTFRNLESIRKRIKKRLVVWSWAEVVYGSLCVLSGGIITGLGNNTIAYYNEYRPCSYYDLNIGEGIWCGIWILIAGGLGIGAGGKRSSRCLIYTHMGFAIYGSIASGILFILDIIRIINAFYKDKSICFGLLLTTIISSFISMIILIVTASYCCCINSATCCHGCCCAEPYAYTNEQQVVYLSNQTQQQQKQQQQQQQPITLQGFPVTTNQLGESNVIQQIPGSQLHQKTVVPEQQTPGFSMHNVAYLPAATAIGASKLADT